MNTPSPDTSARSDRLESWKEIAAYLNRSERTVRRWEAREALPIHRLQHEKRGSVYAYSSELDRWRESRQPLMDLDGAAAPAAVLPRAPSPVWRRWAVAVLVVTLVPTLAAFLVVGRPSGPAPGMTTHPEALRAFRQAQFSGNAGRLQIQSGIRYYQEAIRLDPAFAAAWSGLAAGHMAQTWFDELPAAETIARARREAERAMELEPALAAPLRVLANASHYFDWQHEVAEQHHRTALAIEPDSAWGLSWFAEYLIDMRRFDEARASVHRAQQVEPRWLEPIVVSGNIHAFTGHLDLAIDEYRRALAIEPAFGLGNHFLGRAYLAKGLHAQAVAQLKKSNELLGEVPFSRGDLGYALAISGDRAAAERMIADMRRRRDGGFFPAFPIALIHLGLGQKDAALEWLERAVTERHTGYYLPSTDPLYDRIRSDERFRTMMQRMRLPH